MLIMTASRLPAEPVTFVNTLSGLDNAGLLEKMTARHSAIADLIAEALSLSGRRLIEHLDVVSSSVSPEGGEYAHFKHLRAAMMKDRLDEIGEPSLKHELAYAELDKQRVRRRD
jgi:hypothetical protein